jgi:hypothetical protein
MIEREQPAHEVEVVDRLDEVVFVVRRHAAIALMGVEIPSSSLAFDGTCTPQMSDNLK